MFELLLFQVHHQLLDRLIDKSTGLVAVALAVRQTEGVGDVLASSLALVAFYRLLSQQIPEQHAEHSVRGQTQEHGAHAFVQTQHALGLADLQHAVREAVVQTPLKGEKKRAMSPDCIICAFSFFSIIMFTHMHLDCLTVKC